MANITSTFRRILSDISYADRRLVEVRASLPTATPQTVSTDRRAQVAQRDSASTLHHRSI